MNSSLVVVYIQVKATDRLPRLAGGKTISWPVSRRDLKLWLQETYPVILVVYDGQKDKAYWIHIQAYMSDRRTPELFAGGDTISFHIPIGNRINPRDPGNRTMQECIFTSKSVGRGPEHV